MKKTEIISKIAELAKQDVVLPLSDQFKELTDKFYNILKEEEHAWEIKKLERIKAGEKPEAIEKPVDEEFEKFKTVTAEFKAKRKAEIDAKKEVEENNYKAKKALIAKLKDLIANEEHIGRAIGSVREIREKWNEIGEVARDKRQTIQKEYGHLMDDFNYNIKIYKEIADHDKAKNLKLKKEVIEELKALLSLEKIKDVEPKLRALQNKWSDIGGTYQEEWNKIKEEYYSTVNAIYEKVKAFYEKRKEEQAQNIVKKKELIEEAKKLNEIENTEHKHFQKTTDKFKALQDAWKKIGFGPKDENETVWQSFRAEFDKFFDRKKDFYAERNEVFDKVKAKKEDLIKQVEAIKDSKDWKNAINKIKNIQQKWKQLGSAGPRNENKLWKQFRNHIDYFFNEKDNHFKKLDKDNAGNLIAKESLIEDIKKYKVGKDIKKIIEDLKTFSHKFKEIGNVPFADKDRVYQEYKTALDEKYNQIDLNKDEKIKVLFQAKLDGLLSSQNPEKSLNHERNNIKQIIDKLVKDKNQLENNLGFFANTDDNNPLLKSAKQNIDKINGEIDKLKAQLKLINITERELNKPKDETNTSDTENE
jgi:hypothetical protein